MPLIRQIRLYPLFALIPLLMASGAAGDEGFVAVPSTDAVQYRIDFARLYFPSGSAERADRKDLLAGMKAFEAMIPDLLASPPQLLAGLRRYDAIRVRFFRHDDDLWLHASVDTTDHASRDASADLEARMNQLTGVLEETLGGADPERLSRFREALPELAVYDHYLASLRRRSSHLRPADREKLLAGLAPSLTGWQDALYDTILETTDFGTVAAGEGNLAVRDDADRIRVNPDPEVRAEGFRRLMKGFHSRRELYAFALLRLVKAGNALAALHGFPDRASEVYFRDEHDAASVETLLARVADRADVYKDYEKFMAKRYRHATGVGMHGWDRFAPLAGTPRPRFTIGAATAAIERALAPLGGAYSRALTALLDPANGRMDLVAGPHRRGGGFSTGFVGTPSALYVSGFRGTYRDVSRLAHESTHAVQRTLMSDAGVLPVYAEGSHALAESFAEFSELLLADDLANRAGSPALEAYYLRQFLEIKGIRELFSAAAESSLEKAIYDGVRAGTITGPDDLDRVTLDNDSRFSIWPGREPERAGAWMSRDLFYEDPFYTINYVYAALLAITYYQMYSADPAGFAPRYAALVEEGYTAPAADLLRRHLGIDIDDPTILDRSLAAYRRKLFELSALRVGSAEARVSR